MKHISGPEQDRFGWTMCSASGGKQVSPFVNIADGAYTTVDTMKTSLSYATRLVVTCILLHYQTCKCGYNGNSFNRPSHSVGDRVVVPLLNIRPAKHLTFF